MTINQKMNHNFMPNYVDYPGFYLRGLSSRKFALQILARISNWQIDVKRIISIIVEKEEKRPKHL